jgi:DNA-binding TFAR19-related protein (PDSD5 family)
MYPKQIAKDTAKVLQSYLTYQAVRTIINQLSETNPSQAIWLSQYSDRAKVQDGEAYLDGLMTENKELLLRILIVREDLAQQVLDFLPEMVRTGINQANIEHRRKLLERLTQSQVSNSKSDLESTNLEQTPEAEESSSEIDSSVCEPNSEPVKGLQAFEENSNDHPSSGDVSSSELNTDNSSD